MGGAAVDIPDIPNNEKIRLSSLRVLNVLDTPCEERFDRITRFASYLFNVPIALLSLVDRDRLCFKSSVGPNIFDTSLATSLCGHAILHSGIMTVPDARIYARFTDNPSVIGEP
jgi:hypothetical protein